jgi:8-oxo-dGTP diphosphatase
MDKQNIDRPNTFTVIPRVLAFIEKDDEVLLIERAKKEAFAYKKLNGIGGHVEKGEDPLTAIRREVKEESELDITDFTLRAVIFIDVESDKGVCVFVYSALFSGGEVNSSTEGRLLWAKKSELPHMQVIKDVPLILDIIEESKKDGEVKYLQYQYTNKELDIIRID